MKNERGITLVETLAVIILLTIVSILLFSIMTSGIKSFDRSSTKQRLQQEGNYITETVRKEYLKSGNTPLKLEVGDIDGINKTLLLNGVIISTGYTYKLTSPTHELTKDTPLKLQLIISDNDINYEINTTFSKLN